jgi:hypothetical protein
LWPSGRIFCVNASNTVDLPDLERPIIPSFIL